jgi:exodeoxyribonuclease V gamma subunit
MLSLRFSNHYERLADQLVSDLASERRSPFDAPVVIVPSLALQRDITRRLADRVGVAANLRFYLPGSWLWSLLAGLVPTRAERAPFERDELTWRCYKCLSDPALISTEPVLRLYLDDADELQRLELAESAAQLLRTYANWRPEWLSAWQRGTRVPGLAASRHEPWQARLWRAVSQELGVGDTHPMALFRQELLRRASGDPALRGLPAQVHLFCVDELPPLALGMVEALARHIDLRWYALNPCESFWFDTVSPRRLARMQQLRRAEHAEIGHALLATMAPRSRVHLARLIELDPAMTTDHFDVVEPGPGTALAALQSSILHLDEPPLGAWSDLATNPGIEVHVCHSLTRELEVLHDRLLGHFGHSHELRPGDVLVLVPDIEAAAPLIDAVFGTRRDAGNLPYRITGRRMPEDESALRCLVLVLAESGADWTISKALELLAEPIVQSRFGLGEDDVSRLHRWLDAAGAHRGMDTLDETPGLNGAHPSLPSSLERLVLGFALPDGNCTPLGQLAPVAAAEGRDVDILAAWSRYLEVLTQFSMLSREALDAAQWQEQLISLSARLLSGGGRFNADWLELQSVLADTCTKLSGILADQQLSLPILRHALHEELEGRAAAATPGGSVTFASFHALHPLPFKLIAALGLNDGVVPPRTRAVEHDLLRILPREGDPSQNDAARERFLGLIVAARDRLHLSYTGRSIKDNSILLPSSLITELLDWLVPRLSSAPYGSAELQAARHALVIEQPLQPFARALFDPHADARLRSHDAQWMPRSVDRVHADATTPTVKSRAGTDADAEESDDEADVSRNELRSGLPFFTTALHATDPTPTIKLDALASFLANPARYLLQHRLQIDPWLSNEVPGDDEADAASAARDRVLATLALEQLISGESEQVVEAVLLHHPRMPFGSQAVHAARALVADHQTLALQIRAKHLYRIDDLHVDLPLSTALGPIRIQGRLRNLVQPSGLMPGLLDWRAFEPTANDTLRFWVQHLALCAAQGRTAEAAGALPAFQSSMLHAHGSLHLTQCLNAPEQLVGLVECYLQGQNQPLKFFPKTSRASAEGLTLDKILERWEGRHGRPGERDDPAFALAFRGKADCLDEEFESLAKRIWTPLLEHLLESEDAQ